MLNNSYMLFEVLFEGWLFKNNLKYKTCWSYFMLFFVAYYIIPYVFTHSIDDVNSQENERETAK